LSGHGFKTLPWPNAETGFVAVTDLKTRLSFVGYDTRIVNRLTFNGLKDVTVTENRNWLRYHSRCRILDGG
jgi:hypothetical protein